MIWWWISPKLCALIAQNSCPWTDKNNWMLSMDCWSMLSCSQWHGFSSFCFDTNQGKYLRLSTMCSSGFGVCWTSTMVAALPHTISARHWPSLSETAWTSVSTIFPACHSWRTLQQTCGEPASFRNGDDSLVESCSSIFCPIDCFPLGEMFNFYNSIL